MTAEKAEADTIRAEQENRSGCCFSSVYYLQCASDPKSSSPSLHLHTHCNTDWREAPGNDDYVHHAEEQSALSEMVAFQIPDLTLDYIVRCHGYHSIMRYILSSTLKCFLKRGQMLRISENVIYVSKLYRYFCTRLPC